MKKYLNTLFVTTQGAYLNKEGETIVVSVDKKIRLRIPIHTLSSVVCFGNVMMSPFLMGFCAESHVAICFLNEYGRFLASVHGKISGNVLLRREQYRKADSDEFCINLARNIIIGKVVNARHVLMRSLRDHREKIDVEKMNRAVKRLDFTLTQIERPLTLDEMRGVEGDAARIYFDVFDELILTQKNDFKFDDRNRRPPRDPVNCLLSFIYTILMHDVRSALEAVGMDSCVGYLHKDRPGRASLALDMMEEFRSFFADRLVLSLINREQVNAKGFEQSESGSVLMTEQSKKTVLAAYQQRKQEEINHPFLKETMPLGLVFHIQAMLLARFFRGDLDGYPVFFWK